MRFGVFYELQLPKPWNEGDEHRLFQEALDQVVQAIESLQGGRRVVGVVTHIQELAERLPTRLEVGRSAEGATVKVV